MFSGYADISSSSYTITFNSGESWTWRKDTWFLKELRKRLGDVADILSFTEPMTAKQFIVTFTPYASMSDSEWKTTFQNAFNDMGYKDVSFVNFERGLESSSKGGVLSSVTKLGNVGKSFTGYTKWIVVGVVALAALTYAPHIKMLFSSKEK